MMFFSIFQNTVLNSSFQLEQDLDPRDLHPANGSLLDYFVSLVPGGIPLCSPKSNRLLRRTVKGLREILKE